MSAPYKRVEQIGDATLYLGDCLEILPTLPKVDAVVTDPPYGVNLGAHGAANEKRPQFLAMRPYESYEDTEENLLAVVVPAVTEALQRAERGVVFCAGHNAWHFPRASAIGGVFLPAACGRNNWGFQSISHCLFYGKAPDLQNGSKATAIRSTETSEKSDHPCPKPTGWMVWAVDLATRLGETVLDPFMGSGTTGVACAQLGRRFIGIEIEPRYFDIACRRIDDAYRQAPLIPHQPIQDDYEQVTMFDNAGAAP